MTGAVIDSLAVRLAAIVVGTVLWDVGAVLQKAAVQKLPEGRLRPAALVGSARWMMGLLVTAAGWGLYVFGLDRVPVSAARTVTGGSYVVLALFSAIFLGTPLRLREWLAVGIVTVGIVALGLGESAAPAAAAGPDPWRILVGVGAIVACSAGLYWAFRRRGSRRGRRIVGALAVFAILSGLLSSVGDLMVKVLLLQLPGAAGAGATPAGGSGGGAAAALGLIAPGAALVVFYLAGFYVLSRAYQAGSVVSAVVISDFSARVGAIFLGALALAEPIAAGGPTADALRAAGFLLVLGGSLLLGRFGDLGSSSGSVRGAAERDTRGF